MRKFLSMFVIAAILYYHEVCSDEIRGEQYPNYEYMQIFNGVPALFEYLLNAVEEKPEMLEKNDITMFKRTVAVDKNDHNVEGNKDESLYENCEVETKEQDHKSEDVSGKNTVNRKEQSTVAYEYGNSVLKAEDKCEVGKRETNEALDNPNIKEVDDKITKQKAGENYDVYADFSDPVIKEYSDLVDNEERYSGGEQNLFALNVQPAEIEQGALLAEKLLEEYNFKRTKQNMASV